MKNIGLAILAISLSGCAAMSVEECKTANWSLVKNKIKKTQKIKFQYMCYISLAQFKIYT
jgi:hypothetical protein